MASLLNQFEQIPTANVSNLIFNYSPSIPHSTTTSFSIYSFILISIVNITPILFSLFLVFGGSFYMNRSNKPLTYLWSQLFYKTFVSHFEVVNSKYFFLVTNAKIVRRVIINLKYVIENKTPLNPYFTLAFEFTPIKTKYNTSILFTWLFLSLLLINFLGMVPGTFCWTTSVGWVIGLNILLIMGPILLISIYNLWSYNCHYFYSSKSWPSFFNWVACYNIITNPSYFLVNFLPANTPYYLVWLIIPIEIISYLIRPLSMGLRISGNLIAGHAILHLIHMGVTCCIQSLSLLFWFSSLSIICYMGFLLFEFGVCVIQAYVFTLLAVTFTEQSQEVH